MRLVACHVQVSNRGEGTCAPATRVPYFPATSALPASSCCCGVDMGKKDINRASQRTGRLSWRGRPMNGWFKAARRPAACGRQCEYTSAPESRRWQAGTRSLSGSSRRWWESSEPATSCRWPRAALRHLNESFPRLWRQEGCRRKVAHRCRQPRAGSREDDCDALTGLRPCELTSSGATRASHLSAALPGARWRAGPLRAPPSRANHAVPLGAATCPDL